MGGILGGAKEGLFPLYIGTDFLRAASPGTSRLPLSGCPALAPFGDDSPLLLAERQELVGQQRIGEGKVGTLMHTA